LAAGLFLLRRKDIMEELKNSDAQTIEMEELKDKTRGCLLGVTIGDALGNPFEHLGPSSQNGMLEETGGWITDFHHGQDFPPGAWTDDTGMTLATCRAFIEVLKTYRTVDECIRSAYEDWAGSDEARKSGQTVSHAAKYGVPWLDSWANGALMRISPVAIYAHLMDMSKQDTATLAYRIARTTHGHPLAVFPAVECALALRSILLGDETVPDDLSDPGKYCHYLEPEKNARYGLYQEKRGVPMDQLAPSTGLWMWRYVFEHSLGLSEGSTWNGMPEFEPGLLAAINGGVDKDTTGAVAGAVLGTYWGESLIPERWGANVEKGDQIRSLADQFIFAADSKNQATHEEKI
jgi:ADP-ribosyl-[dinitrogen reductase] hydrolase